MAEQACRSWAAWRNRGIDPGFLAINISRVQFRKRLSWRLAELMSNYGIPPQAMELEITESCIMDDHNHWGEERDS